MAKLEFTISIFSFKTLLKDTLLASLSPLLFKVVMRLVPKINALLLKITQLVLPVRQESHLTITQETPSSTVGPLVRLRSTETPVMSVKLATLLAPHASVNSMPKP